MMDESWFHYYKDELLGEDNALREVSGGRGKFPLGLQTFSEVRECGDYYVDKTMFAHRLAVEGKYYFLSPSSQIW